MTMLSLRRTAALSLLIIVFACSAALAGPRGFDGFWRSTFGLIQFQKSGNIVNGTYSDADGSGRLQGRISGDGRVLVGEWMEGELSGKFLFQLQDGQNSFIGRWRKSDAAKWGQWIAVREADNTAVRNSDPEAYSGAWETNFGKMNLEFDGHLVRGRFSGELNRGTLQGVVDAKTGCLNATWKDNRSHGTVTFEILSGTNGLIGEWRYSDTKYGGKWYGVRHSELGGEVYGDCNNGHGTYLWADGSRYEGDWKNSVAHGKGRFYDENGRLIRNGLWADGVYQGELISGDVIGGRGRIERVDGTRYEGEFKDCQMHGNGTMTFKNGDVYSGDIVNGLAQGKGEYLWKTTGDHYTGQFRNNSIHGEGLYEFRNGSSYEGHFLNGLRSGKGRFSWATGDHYEGSWKDDLPFGKGEYTYDNGDVYAGYFVDGMKEDKGEYVYADGRRLEADWQKDRLNFVLEKPRNATHFARPDDLLIQSSKPAAATSATVMSSGETFLVYQVDRRSLRAGSAASRRNEVVLKYCVVEAPVDLDIATITRFAMQKGDFKGDADFRVERVANPDAKIRQVANRYRFDLSEVRLKAQNNGWFSYVESLQASTR